MDIGTNWQQLRIAVRVALDDTGANITGTPLFYIGVLSSPSANVANGPLSATTSHFVGLRSSAATWTRVATPIVYYQVSSPFQAIKRVNTTNTTAAITGTFNIPSVGSNCRWPILVQITKGNPNYTIQVSYPNGTVTALDITKIGFDGYLDGTGTTQMEAYIEGIQGFNANRMITSSAVTVAVDEGTNGGLNAICLAWDKTAVMRISDVRFRKRA